MWSLRTNDALPLWRPNAIESAAMLAFGTRRGGVSEPPFDSLNVGRSTADREEAVAENRRRMLAACGLDAVRVATAGQVHGATVRAVSAPGHSPDCDALLTQTPGLALAVTTADCMSLLFSAPGTIAAAHSGWRGTAAGMPLATLEAVSRSADVSTDLVTVHLGPCIRGCCYVVGPEVAAAFPLEAVRRNGDDLHLDLPTAARLQLQSAGVRAVFDTGACTACEPHWYFSHRLSRGACGRHWALVALPDGKISDKL
jgi:YfiH family protein